MPPLSMTRCSRSVHSRNFSADGITAEPRHDRAEAGRLRDDVGEFDFEQIAGHRALDENRPGQRMHGADLERGEIGDRRRGPDLPVKRIARLQRDLLAFADFDDRRDVRMVAVVAGAGLLGEALASVDTDRKHALPRSQRKMSPA